MSERQRPPDFKLEAWPVQVSVWTHINEKTKHPWYNFKASKSYKNPATGKWESTTSFSDREIPALILVLQAAYRELCIVQGKIGSGGGKTETPSAF